MSFYLKRVRNGEEVILRDRNLDIARILPLEKADQTQSKLTPAKRPFQEFFSFKAPPVNLIADVDTSVVLRKLLNESNPIAKREQITGMVSSILLKTECLRVLVPLRWNARERIFQPP
jgi:antitoxin (DNA-binding transcriptional repressor) of toxin-antitoxin stability system